MSSEKKAKSGLKTYRPGEIIFREKEFSESLYIIQKGQVRLFTAKGKGFVEIGILRSGEVIGEMAYFDEKSTDCGICDYCIQKNSAQDLALNELSHAILSLLVAQNYTSRQLVSTLEKPKELVLNCIQFLLKEGRIEINSQNEYVKK